MSEEFAAAIGTLKSHLQKQEEEVRNTKRLINQLCHRGGTAIPYPDAEREAASSLSDLRRDAFYGMPLAGAIRKYLEMRRTLGPASVNDIYAALCAGGYKFDAKNPANAKRSLYISLAKNSVTFHKLPGSTDDGAVFGMLEWYPNAKSTDEPKTGKKAKKPKAKKRLPDAPKQLELTKDANGHPIVPAKRRGRPPKIGSDTLAQMDPWDDLTSARKK